MIFVPADNCKPGVAKVSFGELLKIGIQPGAWVQVLDGHGTVCCIVDSMIVCLNSDVGLSLLHLASRHARESHHGESIYPVQNERHRCLVSLYGLRVESNANMRRNQQQ